MAARKDYQKALLPETIQQVRKEYHDGYSTYYLALKYFTCRMTIWEYVKDIKGRKEKRFRYICSEGIQRQVGVI